MNPFFMALLRSQLAASPAWQTFERRRQARLTDALSAMADDACDRDLNVEEATRQHLPKLLEASFPLEDLAEILGMDGLKALGDALGKKGS